MTTTKTKWDLEKLFHKTGMDKFQIVSMLGFSVIGLALFAIVYDRASKIDELRDSSTPPALVQAYNTKFIVSMVFGSIITVIGILLSIFMRKKDVFKSFNFSLILMGIFILIYGIWTKYVGTAEANNFFVWVVVVIFLVFLVLVFVSTIRNRKMKQEKAGKK